MYDKLFDFNINKFAASLLPKDLRHTRQLHWLTCLLAPWRDMLTKFTGFRRKAKYKISHTAQVYSLENVLNDSYDFVARRIYITDGLYRSPVYLYRRIEDKPVTIYRREEKKPTTLYRRSELKLFDVDFVVVIPASLNLLEPEILRLRALIDFYRLPDKTYTLTYE